MKTVESNLDGVKPNRNTYFQTTGKANELNSFVIGSSKWHSRFDEAAPFPATGNLGSMSFRGLDRVHPFLLRNACCASVSGSGTGASAAC